MDLEKIPLNCFEEGTRDTHHPLLLLKKGVRLHFYEGGSIGFYVPKEYMKGKKSVGLLRRNFGPKLTKYSLGCRLIRDTSQANCLLSHILRYPHYSEETPTSVHGAIITRVTKETISQLLLWGALEIEDLWI